MERGASRIPAVTRLSEATQIYTSITARRHGGFLAYRGSGRYLLDMVGDIREFLQARPFIPFTIHVADGREYRVPTPDHVHVYPSGGRVSVYTDDDRQFILPALLLSGLAMDSSYATDS